MNRHSVFLTMSLALSAVCGATAQTPAAPDMSPHTVQFVSVDKDIKLEVLDWGGTGRPLIFLTGMGDTAHVFDSFAPKFTSNHHVFGITRRGFGASSAPPPTEDNYAADRLGDDVLAVIEALKLDKPVLAGHSIAGEELSSIGSRHSEKISGLIYLEAGYGYAYYGRAGGDYNYQVDLNDLRRALEQLTPGYYGRDIRPQLRDFQTRLPRFENELEDRLKGLQQLPARNPNTAIPPENAQEKTADAIIAGEQKYTDIKGAVLAIFWVPPAAQADAFEAGVPGARVIRLTNAKHYIYFSNETDVLREMNSFMDDLDKVSPKNANGR
jgi:non-heme chloroperoxidase